MLSIEEKAEQTLRVTREYCTWSFVLPAIEVSELRVYSTNNVRCATVANPKDRQIFSVVPGTYFLYADTYAGSVELGPFEIPEGGLWMDELDISGASTLGGVVIDGKGNPLAGVPVHATAESGYSPQSAVTNSDGAFRFSGVPPGEYHVRCEVGRFTGGLASDCSVSTFIGCGASVTNLRIRIVSEGVTVHFHSDNNELLQGRAFVLSGDDYGYEDGVSNYPSLRGRSTRAGWHGIPD
jgi:hypothetical protein